MNISMDMDELREMMMADASAARGRIIKRDGRPGEALRRIEGGGKTGSTPAARTVAMLAWLAENGPKNNIEIAHHFGKTSDSTRSTLSNYLTGDIVQVIGREVVVRPNGSVKARVWQVGPGYDAWAKAEAARNG